VHEDDLTFIPDSHFILVTMTLSVCEDIAKFDGINALNCDHLASGVRYTHIHTQKNTNTLCLSLPLRLSMDVHSIPLR
jgi:hypothetical protein